MDFSRDLNSEQQRAVFKKDGPSLILAGAGSGKTRVLVYKIAYLLISGVRPENILAVTFTNKAADEMKNRVAVLTKRGERGLFFPWLGTFHSICARILRREIEPLGYSRNFSIYDESDQLALMRRVIKKLGFDQKLINPNMALARISRAKNELINPEAFEELYGADFLGEKISLIYKEYQRSLKSANVLDFDDLLLKAIELFEDEKILEKYQKKFQYILIDEYQDTNHAQYRLIKMLAKSGNICVVGDPDQAIYGWRGADIRNILNFEKDFPKAEVFRLEQNYRSTKNILKAAQNVIAKNIYRKEKELWTKNPDGEKILRQQVFNEIEEAEFVVEKIKEILRSASSAKTPESRQDSPLTLSEASYKQFAVFYRIHAQSRILEEIMLKNEIPYRIVGGVRFYERKEIKDLLAWLRILNSPTDMVSLKRIINIPPRGIGEGLADKISSLGDLDRIDFKNFSGITPRSKKALAEFLKIFTSLRKKVKKENVVDLLQSILKETGYKEWLLDGTEEGEMRFENIRELLGVARKYSNLLPEESQLAFLEGVTLFQDIDNWNPGEDAITLMTLHSAKGLEFPVVFMVGMEEGIFPHSRSFSEIQEMEEERRLCYVGMTRAKEKLILTFAASRMLYGLPQANLPSRFLADIPEDIVWGNDFSQEEISENMKDSASFQKGSRVWHKDFGEGVVLDIKKEILTISFESGVVKKIIANQKYLSSLDV